jgi:hypothetical protein
MVNGLSEALRAGLAAEGAALVGAAAYLDDVAADGLAQTHGAVTVLRLGAVAVRSLHDTAALPPVDFFGRPLRRAVFLVALPLADLAAAIEAVLQRCAPSALGPQPQLRGHALSRVRRGRSWAWAGAVVLVALPDGAQAEPLAAYAERFDAAAATGGGGATVEVRHLPALAVRGLRCWISPTPASPLSFVLFAPFLPVAAAAIAGGGDARRDVAAAGGNSLRPAGGGGRTR